MSFKVLYSRPDVIFLSSQQKSGPVDIQIDRKTHLFSVRVIEEETFYTTEEGQKFWRIISNVDYEQKVNQYGRFYNFKNLTSFEKFCKDLYEHQLMNADAFNALGPYLDGLKKISTALKRVPAFPEKLLSFLDEPEDVESLLNLCVKSNRLESYQKWLNSVACEKSPKRCFAALFMRLKREGKELPDDAKELIWNLYGSSFLHIEQKSHVKLLFDFLHVSSQFKEEEILAALIAAQSSLKMRKAEDELLFRKLKEAPLGLILREPLLFKNLSEEKLVELWTCLLKRVLDLPATVETLKMGVVLFSHIPSSCNKWALIEYEKWLDLLFGFYFNGDFGPGLIEDIKEIQRNHYPYFGIGVQNYLELSIVNKIDEHFSLAISFDSIAHMAATTAINCMAVNRKFIDPEEYSSQLASLLESCQKRLPEDGEEILLSFLDKDHLQLYMKFIERLTRYKPKSDFSSYFIMAYARFHLINFIELFPSHYEEASYMGEEIALMRMPKSEFIEQLHDQAMLLFIGKYFVFREVELKPFSLYKMRLLGTFDVRLSLNRKAVHKLLPAITLFVNKLLNNGSFFHVSVAQECLKNLNVKTLKCDLEDKIAKALEKHVASLCNH